MKKLIIIFLLYILFSAPAFCTIFYLDYDLGDDANDGSDWANAWKTFTLGATAARIAPGDIIRIAKSPAPVSIGNATWTNESKTVTLAGAQTLDIDDCEVVWTAGEAAAIRDSSFEKEGTYDMKLTASGTPSTDTLQAYYATGELDLSSYQKISFWFRNQNDTIANNWEVCLCSDVAGETVVDTFEIPAIPSENSWLPLTLTKVGGGNLGASIKSIALYSGSDVTAMASKYVLVDNFMACTTNGLNLQSLISKDSAEQDGTDGWYGIQSIKGVTVLLDNGVNTYASLGFGYSTVGTTPDTVTTYKRETIKTALAITNSTKVQEIMDLGTAVGGNIEFQGGYNTGDSQQDGETFFDGLNGQGYGIYKAKNFITLNYISACRYTMGHYWYGSSKNSILTNARMNNNTSSGFSMTSGGLRNTFDNISILNNSSSGFVITGSDNNKIGTMVKVNNNSNFGYWDVGGNNNRVSLMSEVNNNQQDGILLDVTFGAIINQIAHCKWNGDYGLHFYGGMNDKVWSIVTEGNSSGAIEVRTNAKNCMVANALMAEATEITALGTAGLNYRFYSMFHDQGTNHKIFTDGGAIVTEATDRIGGTGIMWKLSPTTTRDSWYPLTLSIAKIAVVADKLVTVNVHMKKSHATDVGAKLVCRGAQLAGIGLDDIVDTKADDVDTWEELEITFTPTQAGVVEIEAWACYVGGAEDVYVEDMTIVQAE